MTWQRPKPITIGLFGDSTFYGRLAGVTDGRQWMTRLYEQLQQQPEAIGDIILVNMGQGSQTSDWGVANAPRLAALRPDFVLNGFTGINDSVVTGGTPAVSLSTAQSNLASMRAIFKAANPNVVTAWALMNGVGDGDAQTLRPNLPNYYSQAKTYAQSVGDDCIDNYNGMSAPGQPGGWVKPLPGYMTDNGDKLHPLGLWFDVYAMPNILFWCRRVMAQHWGLPAPTAPAIAPLPPTRIFTVSPALNGKTTWNLDSDGDLAVGVASSAQQHTITPESTFTVSFNAWGEGVLSSKGGYVAGTDILIQGQPYIIRTGYGRSSAGGYAGLFQGGATQANAVFVAAGAGAGVNGGEGGGAGGADIGQAGYIGTYHGQGGTQTAGGAKADESHGESSGATVGAALQGGYPGNPTQEYDEEGNPLNWNSGGGGGAGYFGGGGGSAGGSFAGSGGGGSNFLRASVTNRVSERGGGRTNPRRGSGGDSYFARIVLF